MIHDTASLAIGDRVCVDADHPMPSHWAPHERTPGDVGRVVSIDRQIGETACILVEFDTPNRGREHGNREYFTRFELTPVTDS